MNYLNGGGGEGWFGESCRPVPGGPAFWEKVAVREGLPLTFLLLVLLLIKTQPMPIKTPQELLLLFCLSTERG